MDKTAFKNIIWDYYRTNRRPMPWRDEITEYGVVVSELMLQQTQVVRVLIKYPEFMNAFPTFQALASSPLVDLLRVWQGMGYNRRAKYLQAIAQKIVKAYGGALPTDPEILETFPGIGPATARSIVTYAFNKPEVFIETNIRRIFIHHFFQDKEGISDKELYPFVEATVDQENPRDWYYALMDYGTYLAKQVPNPNRKSKHYTKQSKFEGSKRQVRGTILKILLDKGNLDREALVTETGFNNERVYPILEDMKQEGFISEEKGEYFIKDK